MAWFAVADYRRGYALAFSLILINLAADLVYVVFPVTTDIYRAELLAHPLVGNAFASAMYAHYGTDPSFNCFPSLHAAVATINVLRLASVCTASERRGRRAESPSGCSLSESVWCFPRCSSNSTTSPTRRRESSWPC